MKNGAASKFLLGVFTAMIAAVLATAVEVRAAVPNYNCEVQTAIPVEQCEALVTVYEATGGEQWTTNTGWLSDPNPCTWHGVSCDAGEVVALNLFANNLSGELPLEIGGLASLRTLTLNDNPLRGAVPLTVTFLDLDLFHFHRTQMCEPMEPSFQDWLFQIVYRLGSGIYCVDLTPTVTPRDTQAVDIQSTRVSTVPTELPWPQQTLTALAAEAQATAGVEATATKYYSVASPAPAATKTPPSTTAAGEINGENGDADGIITPVADGNLPDEIGGFLSRIPKVWFLLLMIPVTLIVFGLYLELRQRRLDDEPYQVDVEVSDQLYRLDYTDPHEDK